jgi:hypothetical protein
MIRQDAAGSPRCRITMGTWLSPMIASYDALVQPASEGPACQSSRSFLSFSNACYKSDSNLLKHGRHAPGPGPL